MVEKIRKSEEEWRRQLTPEQYRVAREQETEKRFSHAEHNAKVTGVYHCVCCRTPLFEAKEKFDSGTGWPSFWTPVSEDAIETRPTSATRTTSLKWCVRAATRIWATSSRTDPNLPAYAIVLTASA